MKQRLPIGLLIFLLVLGAFGVVCAVALYPWLARPSPRELEAGWREVEGWAALSQAEGDAEALLKADLAVESRQDEINAVVQPVLAAPGGRLDERALPEEARIALRALEAWDRAGAGLGQSVCGDALSAVPLLTMGHLLLAVAGKDPHAPELDRALRLGAALRTSGDNRIVTIGFNLADEALDWARVRKIGPTPSFSTHRPRAGEVFRAAARDAVCTWQRATRLIGQEGLPALLTRLGSRSAPAWARPFLDPERELDKLRAFHVARLRAAWPDRENLGLLRAHLDLPPRDDLPAAALVRGMVEDPGEYFERWREVSERYDRWLGERGP